MKKIKSLFKRNYDGDRLVYNEVVEGSEWVIAGEGIATVKIDGTSCLVRGGKLYKRFDRKPARKLTSSISVMIGTEPVAERWLFKPAPDGWFAAQEPDEHTGHWPGWVPVSDTDPADQYHREAWQNLMNETVKITDDNFLNGTYELIGAKVQGNPYKLYGHALIPHGADKFSDDPPRDFEGLRQWFETHHVEGIVWHRDNGDMVKLKRRDFGLEWNGRK